MNKKFSIIFPSRERPHLLEKLFSSLAKTTSCLNDIEVLVAVDTDDEVTKEYALSCSYLFVKWFFVTRSLNFSRDYYTMLAQSSTGSWIIAANDDAVFETQNWDVLGEAALRNQPGVIYGWIEDELGEWRAKGHGDYCCFPLFGRRGYEALGYIFPARIPTWGADIWAKGLYDSVGSVIKLPFTMKHYNYHNGTREQDEVSKRIMNNQVPFDVRPSYNEVNILLDALKQELQPTVGK